MGNPVFDWHALAPDLILVGTILVVLVADLVLPERSAWHTSRLASFGVLGALIPIATLAVDGVEYTVFPGSTLFSVMREPLQSTAATASPVAPGLPLMS